MEKKYWLHRISHHMEVSYNLLERGVLSIGWSDFSTPDFIENCTDSEENLNQVFEDYWGCCPRNRFSLLRFLNMKKGDYVIIPSWGEFHVYEIEEDKSLSIEELDISGLKNWHREEIVLRKDGYLGVKDKKDDCIDLGFFRRIRPIATDISRRDYANPSLTSRMKVRQTNLDISDLEESIKSAISAFKNKKPINLYSIIMNKTQKVVFESLQKSLTPNKLERLIALYLRKIGADEVTIPPKNENDKQGDVDVIGVFSMMKVIICVQAKKHVGETDDWAISQIDAYVTQMKNKKRQDEECSYLSWVVSTADNFSDACVKKARTIEGLLLIDGNEFSKMLLESGITPDFSEI